jgi:4-hydroxy-2-oxoglutarate aldolase
MKRLAGILAPVVTTFDERDELARAPFSANIRAHLAAGLAGVVVAGSTGEAALLDDEERRALVVWAREDVPGDRWLIVGVGSESTRQSVRRTKEAAERGADAVLVVAPHYYGSAMTPPALRAHYARVADASPVPVVLYNIPKYMHFALAPELVAELAEHGNIVGVKDSSGDAALLAGYLGAQSHAFSVLTGSAGGLAAALAAGARGGVLAVSLFAPELALEVLRDGGMGEGAAQSALVPLAREIVGTLGVPGVKAALDLSGLHGGPVRPPLLPLADPERRRVAGLLRGARVVAAA